MALGPGSGPVAAAAPASSGPVVKMPGLSHIEIPMSGRRAAVAGISMRSMCRPLSVTIQRAAAAAVMLAGPRVIPGQRSIRSIPVPAPEWAALRTAWRSAVGSWDDEVLYRRPQSGRHGFALLLLRRGRGLAFIRVSPDAERTAREYSVMLGVHAARPDTFRVAFPLAEGSRHGWGWMAVESGPNHPTGALRRAADRLRVVDEITDILTRTLHRDADTPAHWVGCHGDLSPWNVRTGRGRSVWVIDWEDAQFGPPGADLLYSGLTAELTFGSPVVRGAEPEAIEWMRNLVSNRRQPDETELSENNRLLAALDRLRGSSQ